MLARGRSFWVDLLKLSSTHAWQDDFAMNWFYMDNSILVLPFNTDVQAQSAAKRSVMSFRACCLPFESLKIPGWYCQSCFGEKSKEQVAVTLSGP